VVNNTTVNRDGDYGITDLTVIGSKYYRTDGGS